MILFEDVLLSLVDLQQQAPRSTQDETIRKMIDGNIMDSRVMSLIGRTAEDIPSPGSPNEYTPDDWNRRWTHNRSRLKHSEAMSDVQAGMGKPAYAE